MVIKLFSTRPLTEWSANARQPAHSLGYVAVFAVVVTISSYLLMRSTPPPTGALDRFTIGAILLTHLLVIGTTQEILYRGFLQTFLEQQWRGSGRCLGQPWSRAGVLAAGPRRRPAGL